MRPNSGRSLIEGRCESFLWILDALPGSNAEVFRIELSGEPRGCWFGARFRASRFEGEEGRGLRGFYLDDPDVSKGPLTV